MAPKGNLKWKTILRIKQPSFISIRAAVVTCKGRSMSVMLMDEIPSQMEVTSKKKDHWTLRGTSAAVPAPPVTYI